MKIKTELTTAEKNMEFWAVAQLTMRAKQVAVYAGESRSKLSWADLRIIGKTDGGNRWYPISDIAGYFRSIRAPSRAWPNSYAKAAQTLRFAKWLRINHPALADRLRLLNK